MGRFPIRSRSGHCYIMIALYCNINSILIEHFQYHNERHHIAAYSRIMTRLCERGHAVDLQVLDNEASKEYCRVIMQTRKSTFQLVTPDVHCCNATERAI